MRLRFYGGSIFRCDAHLDRLHNSAKAIGLNLPMSNDKILAAMEDTITRSGQKDGYIRLVVTRGVGQRLGIDASTCRDPRTIVIVDELALVPAEIVQHGIKGDYCFDQANFPDQLDLELRA